MAHFPTRALHFYAQILRVKWAIFFAKIPISLAPKDHRVSRPFIYLVFNFIITRKNGPFLNKSAPHRPSTALATHLAHPLATHPRSFPKGRLALTATRWRLAAL